MAKKSRKKLDIAADGTFFLKLTLFLIVGAQWLRLTDYELTKQVPLPLGLIIGMAFAWHEHFQIDRRIEYAVLLVATFIGYWTHTGIYMPLLK